MAWRSSGTNNDELVNNLKRKCSLMREVFVPLMSESRNLADVCYLPSQGTSLVG